MNSLLAQKVIQQLLSLGIEEIIFCPGGRNAPFLPVIQKLQSKNPAQLKSYSFFEERSAAFFALGRIEQTRKPVAIMMTSGTAVAECLPAVIEAYYQGLPLLIVSADRPRHFRGSGAPQTIDQVHLFGKYVQSVQDIASLEEIINLTQWDQTQPFHLNVCFGEPLMDQALLSDNSALQPVEKINQQPTFFHQPIKKRKLLKPLVILGPRPIQLETLQLKKFLKNFVAPIWYESLANLSDLLNDQDLDIENQLLRAPDLWIKKAFQDGLLNTVVKIGGTPTPRFWRDLDLDLESVPVLSVSHLEFKGLGRGVAHYRGYHHLDFFESDWSNETLSALMESDRVLAEKVKHLLNEFPLSEVSLLSQFKEKHPFDYIFLGNSLPIREWDLKFSLAKNSTFWGLRGVNGIDGQISSFLGSLEPQKKSLGVFGDLTALYDLAGLWPSLNEVSCNNSTILIVNNSGGQIFKNLFSDLSMLNTHSLNFENWAKMWNWNYQCITQVSELSKIPERCIVELRPDTLQTENFWQSYRKLS